MWFPVSGVVLDCIFSFLLLLTYLVNVQVLEFIKKPSPSLTTHIHGQLYFDHRKLFDPLWVRALPEQTIFKLCILLYLTSNAKSLAGANELYHLCRFNPMYTTGPRPVNIFPLTSIIAFK